MWNETKGRGKIIRSLSGSHIIVGPPIDRLIRIEIGILQFITDQLGRVLYH